LPQTGCKRQKVTSDIAKEDNPEDDDDDTSSTAVKQARRGKAGVGGTPPAMVLGQGAGSKQAGVAVLQLAASSSSAAKLAKELDASEKVSLGVTQMLKKVEDNAQLAMVTQKLFRSHLSKVESRLTPELAALYTHGYDGTNVTPGVRMYEELDKQLAKLKSLEGLIRCFAATEGKDSTAQALEAEHKLATDAGIVVASVVQTSVCARGFKECLDAHKFSECAEILDRSSDHVYGVSHMPSEEQASSLQSQLMLVNIVGLLKTGTEIAKDKTDEIKVATRTAAGILSELFKAVNAAGCEVSDKVMDTSVKRLERLVHIATSKAPIPEETLAKAEARPSYGRVRNTLYFMTIKFDV